MVGKLAKREVKRERVPEAKGNQESEKANEWNQCSIYKDKRGTD